MFLNTLKRQVEFLIYAAELNQEQTRKEKLNDYVRQDGLKGTTRLNSLNNFFLLCLEEMTCCTDNRTSTKAHMLLLCLKEFELNIV